MTRRFPVLLLAVFLSAARAFAQAPPTGTLRLTVVDPSNAIVVGAPVTVTSAEAAPAAPSIAPARTTDAGVATVANLPPGRYTIEAEFPGFEKRVLKDVRIRPGENKQVAVLQISKLEAAVTVGQSKQEAAADPRTSFGTSLTRAPCPSCLCPPPQGKSWLFAEAPSATLF